MEIRYDLNREDYKAICDYVLVRYGLGPEVVIPRLFCALFCFIISIVAFACSQTWLAVFLICLGCAILVLALLGSRRFMGYLTVKYALSKLGSENVFGPVTLTLEPDRLIEVTTAARSEVFWDKVVAYHETPEHIFVLVTSQSIAVIPRRAFDSDDGYHRARDFIRDKLKRLAQRV